MKALPVYIYKSELGDCSNNGISSKYTKILLIHPEGFIEVDENDPPENLCKFVERKLFGDEIHKHIEPYAKAKGVGWMASGSLVYCSDSRFHDYSDYPLVLHDRDESQELYDILSR